MSVLVLGLGNALRGDDAVGLEVVRLLAAGPPLGVQLCTSAASGLRLLDELEGFAEAVIVDVVVAARGRVGEVAVLDLAELVPHAAPTAHAVGLPTALAAARAFGAAVPARVRLVVVAVADLATVRESLSEEARAALPAAAERVRACLRESGAPSARE